MDDKAARDILMQAVEHAAYAGAFATLRPEVRAQIQAAVEVLKAPELAPADGPQEEGVGHGVE